MSAQKTTTNLSDVDLEGVRVVSNFTQKGGKIIHEIGLERKIR